ncbi:TNF receptor-associated factor homolog 1a [Silene latifolia]|uniref:TNF receptor-associated factor homolog 1a n=1 Tax=Silene latifolia TaxID=37657 RepID=UPI003D778883
MATTTSEETTSGRMEDGLSNVHYRQSSDDDYDGPKPSDLYGTYTWKIQKFSQINTRLFRSSVFEIGGHSWYLLLYPRGVDDCNYLGLFLCVANHNQILPGWKHYTQFTIAAVNKDPKFTKYSDTMHRYWKKEHDWGWKKFMQLSKLPEGYLDADTLIVEVQVQVIRKKKDRLFQCLDSRYRRDLLGVYFPSVEEKCQRFIEETRAKLRKLMEDKARWSSFCAFWLGMDQNARHRLSSEEKDMMMKVLVKHHFERTEVTSALVMDCLYCGLKALESQSNGVNEKPKLLELEETPKKDMDSSLDDESNGTRGKTKCLEYEETPSPIIRVEKDMFVLANDLLLLLERVAKQPLSLPQKDDKEPQICTKDGSSGEDLVKDLVEHDDGRLMELGQRTLEMFVLAHIFSNKIEFGYQEAVALKRQEELIREEEAASLVTKK